MGDLELGSSKGGENGGREGKKIEMLKTRTKESIVLLIFMGCEVRMGHG